MIRDVRVTAVAVVAAAALSLLAVTVNVAALIVALLAVAVAAVAWRRHRRVASQRDRLELLYSLAADSAHSHTVEDAMGRLLRHSATVLRASRAELIFFTPPNKLIHASSLHDGVVALPDARVPESTRELIREWAEADPHGRRLGRDDAHPLRTWMRAGRIGDALVVPLLFPDPHGVMILGNAVGGPFTDEDLRTAEGFAAHGLETLLRCRREEILAEIQAQHGDVGDDGLLDPLTGLPHTFLLERHLDALTRRGTSGVAVATISLDGLDDADDAWFNAGPGPSGREVLLAEIGRRLLDTVRRTDLVARTDDAHFALVMTGLADVRVALSTCERLVAQITRPLVHDRQVLATGCSIGIAMGEHALGSALTGQRLLADSGVAQRVAATDSVHAIRVYSDDIDQPDYAT